MLFFYFVIFLYSAGGMILIYIFYKKKAKYLYENVKISIHSIGFMFYTAGIFNLVLGTVHRLFLYSPGIQIKVLIGLQASYILFYLSHILKKKYETICLCFTIVLMSFCRILFYILLLIPPEYTLIFADFLDNWNYTIFKISVGLMGFSICILFAEKANLIIKIIKFVLKR